MILRMSEVNPWHVTVTDSLVILAGGIWYMLIALLFYRLTPYRPAQRALGDCVHETAKFLLIKSDLYDTTIDFGDEYHKLISQQIIVNEKQDAVRELLFKNKDILEEPSRTARLMVLAFADTVDLYEQITAIWYDYKSLRERFGETGILDDVSGIIKHIAHELDNIGLAIQSNSVYTKQYDLIPALDKLKQKIDVLEVRNKSNLVLKKILVNLRSLGEHVDELLNYFSPSASKEGIRSKNDYSKFVSHQEIDIVILKNNFNLSSGVFRHALRMMITCIAGFIIAKLISYGHHSYWILLTIIILLKPGFSLTRQRNIERFAGTIAGGIMGVLILYFIHDRDVLFALIIFFMIGTYTFQRLNYILMVIFTTPYILILLNLLGLGFLNIVRERLIDTAIACLLSFFASYVLFPHWESGQLKTYMKHMLKANIDYLEKLQSFFAGKDVPAVEYKLARKEVYISMANLAAAFQRMLSEPKSKQRNGKTIYEFVVLNHVLSANIAGISADMLKAERKPYQDDIVRQVKRSVNILQQSLQQLDETYAGHTDQTASASFSSKKIFSDKQIQDQLDFIHKITMDIKKTTLQILT